MQKQKKEERLLAQAVAQAAAQARLLKARTVAMRCWDKTLTPDAIADIAELPQKDVDVLIAAFEKVKAYTLTHKQLKNKELMKLSGLQEAELNVLLSILNPRIQ